MDPSTFVSALLAIVVIDLVLAGDNALVIALAGPHHDRSDALERLTRAPRPGGYTVYSSAITNETEGAGEHSANTFRS